MQIPKEIKGKNRKRDFIICCDYLRGKSPEEIKKERALSITERRVYKIIFNNQEFINPRITWPKARRVWLLQKMVDEAPESKKDKADLIDQLRKEVEGEKPLVDNSKHTHITYQWNSNGKDHNDRLLPSGVSGRDSQ